MRGRGERGRTRGAEAAADRAARIRDGRRAGATAGPDRARPVAHGGARGARGRMTGRRAERGPHGAQALPDRVAAIHDGQAVEAGAPDRAGPGLAMTGRWMAGRAS